MTTCPVTDCGRPSRSRGFCNRHYERWRLHGDAHHRKPKAAESLEQRFWAQVDTNGPVPSHRPELGPCWLWTGVLDSQGYGRIREGRAGTPHIRANRASLQLKLGRPIRPGYVSCHACDNPPCVNPGHLFEGTQLENMHDAAIKGRMRNGERHPFSKLTDEERADVVASHRAGASQAVLARRFGVTYQSIARIVRRAARLEAA